MTAAALLTPAGEIQMMRKKNRTCVGAADADISPPPLVNRIENKIEKL